MSFPGTPQSAPRAAPRRILEDASGRRLQRMRWVGRLVALLFLVWLAIVILGGLGVGPVGRLPLGHVLRPSAGPPPLRHVPAPSAPAAADLVPALPAPVLATTEANGTKPATTTPGKSGVAPGHATTTTSTAPGRSGLAPGHTSTSPGKSVTAPGRVRHPTTTTAAMTTTVPGHRKKP
jgi:hypothetical protein